MIKLNLKEIKNILIKKKLSKFENEILESINIDFNNILNKKIKDYQNKLRVIKNDEKKEHLKAIDYLSKPQIENLPNWVKKDIENAQIIWSSKNIIQTSDKRKYHLKNSLNDLSWQEWTFFLNSVINTRYTTSWVDSLAYHIRKIHPSPKPPQLMGDIIKFFTKENDLVLDYFMWVWWTLLGASLTNRRAFWIDLSEKYIKAYKEANSFLWLKEQPCIKWDSIELLKNNTLDEYIKNEELSLILIDPPYWDMMNKIKTWENIKKGKDLSATPYTDFKEDLWNMERWEFRKKFQESVKNSMKYLKKKWHLVVFIKDMQPKWKELNLLHCDLILDLNKIDNLKYLWIKIWADQWVNLYPYWYPYSYVSNQIHQYILIFQKV